MSENYDVKLVPAIIYIPENTVKLTNIATVMEDADKLIEVSNTMKTAEVIEARIEGEYWEADNVQYRLIENGGV